MERLGPQGQDVKVIAAKYDLDRGIFPPGMVFIVDRPHELMFERKEVFDTRDSHMVRAVVEYEPLGRARGKYSQDIVIKFPDLGRNNMFRQEYEYFKMLAKKDYPWFPKPVGILDNPFGIAVTKCEGDKLSYLLSDNSNPNNPLTLSEKSHVLRELSKAFIALMDEDIAIFDWKKADVIFDRKTKRVSYVDLNVAGTISQQPFSPLPPSLYKFYENVVLPLIGQDYVFPYTPSGKKLSAISRSFSDLPTSEQKRAITIHLQNLTLEQTTAEFKN